MVACAAGKICRRIFVTAGGIIAWKGRPVDPAWSNDTGKGISKLLKRDRTEEKFLLTCGASAGLSAAFHAPLAGVMFSLEEVHKNFSVSVLISVMTASITADYISSQFIGIEPVFQFDIGNVLPQNYYWMIVVLGVILGCFGAFYNWFTLTVQAMYKKVSWLNEVTRLLIPFTLAGIFCIYSAGITWKRT